LTQRFFSHEILSSVLLQLLDFGLLRLGRLLLVILSLVTLLTLLLPQRVVETFDPSLDASLLPRQIV